MRKKYKNPQKIEEIECTINALQATDTQVFQPVCLNMQDCLKKSDFNSHVPHERHEGGGASGSPTFYLEGMPQNTTT